jgi:hypothetical protein
VFGAPAAGYELRASLARPAAGDPTGFVLQVRARLDGVGAMFPEQHTYRAVIAGVAPGQHSLRVQHIVESVPVPWLTPLETMVWVERGS